MAAVRSINSAADANGGPMIITGFHSIEEKIRSLLKNNDAAKDYKLFYSKPGPRIKKILDAAKQAGVTAEQTDDKKLDELVKDLDPTLQDHRGIVMTISGQQKQAENLVDFDAWIKKQFAASNDSTRQTIIILDKITDPHNVGAIIRSCDQFGVSLVIIPEHNSASNIASNEIIGRSSAGASAWVPVAIVKNLVRAVEQLKQAGFWIYGADAGGQNITSLSFAQKSAIIMGSEGSGIDSLLQKNCDTIVSIPTCGKIDSLNVSVAAGVLLYEVYRNIIIQEK